MCWKYFNKKVKKMDMWDIGLIKISVAAFVLFIISFFPSEWISQIIELKWLWLVLFVIFAIKPAIKVFSK
jgi:hypothetical protein